MARGGMTFVLLGRVARRVNQLSTNLLNLHREKPDALRTGHATIGHATIGLATTGLATTGLAKIVLSRTDPGQVKSTSHATLGRVTNAHAILGRT